MRRWRFKKNMTSEEFESFRLATDIMVHIGHQHSIINSTKDISNNPEALKFYLKHQSDRIIESIEHGDFND